MNWALRKVKKPFLLNIQSSYDNGADMEEHRPIKVGEIESERENVCVWERKMYAEGVTILSTY